MTTEFSLGFLASGLTAWIDGKKFDAASAVKGAALGAATAGALTLFGGTKFATSIKDAFTTKGKFKSNIDKAFSVNSLGVVDGKFKPGNVLFNDTKGGQKTGFHGINGQTKSDPATGEVKTKVTTPDGAKTETKITPPGPKADQVEAPTTCPSESRGPRRRRPPRHRTGSRRRPRTARTPSRARTGTSSPRTATRRRSAPRSRARPRRSRSSAGSAVSSRPRSRRSPRSPRNWARTAVSRPRVRSARSPRGPTAPRRSARPAVTAVVPHRSSP